MKKSIFISLICIFMFSACAKKQISQPFSHEDVAAFITAAKDGDDYIVKEYLLQGMSVNIKDEWGRTALMSAASNGQEGVVRYLVNKGASLDEKDKYGNTAIIYTILHYNIWSQNHLVNIIDLLIKFGADVNARDNNGDTALAISYLKEFEWMIKILKEHGAVQ